MRDPWVTKMRNLPATVVSTTLKEPLDWPDAAVVPWRRRRRRRAAQGGVRGALALPRQPVHEPGADGGRSGRPRPGDTLSRPHRSEREPTRSSKVRPTSTWNCSTTRTLDGHIQELIYRPTLTFQPPLRGSAAVASEALNRWGPKRAPRSSARAPTCGTFAESDRGAAVGSSREPWPPTRLRPVG